MCLLLAGAAPARAWNYAGHMIVAKIAWLKLSPEQRAKVSFVLKHHPHYATHLAAGKPNDVEVDEWAFLRAATWPDMIRPRKGFSEDKISTHPVYRFHRGPWHYIDYPYRAGESIGEKLPAPLPAESDILRQLPLSIDVATTGADDPARLSDVGPAANRAVRLCWLLHLIGDLHQPLHSTALVDPRVFPDGQHDDQGGNLIAVRAAADGKPLRLHSYWDGLLGSDTRYDSVAKFAAELLAEPALAADKVPELAHTTVAEWTRESFEHAVESVYLNGKLPVVSYVAFDEGRIAAADVPVLPDEAQQNARKLARRRVVLAGLRIAKQLAEIAPAATR